MNKFHEANRRYWDNSAPEWHEEDKNDWRECVRDPSFAFEGHAFEFIQEFIGDLKDKRVCIVGSGDNHAAFALASLGAEVTSIDISGPRLKLAAQRAESLGLKIRFVCHDAASLKTVKSAQFDLVCSTNGFFVWISGLSAVFSEVNRILKPGGFYIFYDIHPFMRPWKEQAAIEMQKPYAATGPFKSGDSGRDVYNFHWTISDIINSLLQNGLVLCRMMEDTARYPRFWTGHSIGHGGDSVLLDWHQNPRAGLPAWLTVACQKPFV